jgi:threonine dehydratase
VTCSDGHYALSVSFIARQMKIKATIFMPDVTSSSKIEGIEKNGK